MFRSDATTQDVRVQVTSMYIPERSHPASQQWFFAYRIRITNLGEEVVQLLNRYWLITDAEGQTQEVRGPGVVGEQPVLGPGQSFEYTSACPLHTPVGSMQGSYEMVRLSDGWTFEARVAPFTLAVPEALN